jgi:hypothetical protein
MKLEIASWTEERGGGSREEGRREAVGNTSCT